jgi:hypothetical protein
MIFTAEQGRVLAVTGTRTDLGFDYCDFYDGDAFLEAFAARLDSETSGRLPFHVEQFILFLSQQRKLNV